MKGTFVLYDVTYSRFFYVSPQDNAIIVSNNAKKEVDWFDVSSTTVKYDDVLKKLHIEDGKTTLDVYVQSTFKKDAGNLQNFWLKLKERNTHQAPNIAMETELNSTKQMLEETKNKLAYFEQQLVLSNQQLQQKDAQIKEMNTKTEEKRPARKAPKQDQLTLVQQLDSSQRENNVINTKLSTTENLLLESQSLNAALNELATTRNKLTANLDELRTTRNDLLATQSQIQSIKKEYKATKERLESTQKQLETLQSGVHRTHSDFTSVQQQRDQLQSQLSSSAAERTKILDELQRTKQQLSQTERQLENTKQTLKESSQHLELARAKNKDNEVALLSMQKRLADTENSYKASATQVSNLSATQAKLNGMFQMGGTVLTCASKFKELNNDLVNVVWSMSNDENEIDILFPIISKIGFHEFWATILQTDEEVRQETKIEVAKQMNNKEFVAQYASMLAWAAQSVINSSPGISNNMIFGPESELHKFYGLCAEWHSLMISCDPALELLPKERIPKKGTLLNNIVGQQFDFDFGDIGCPLIDCVETPGLRIRDLNGTILQKAKIKCYFASKK